MVASRLIPEIRLNAHIGKNACEIEKNKNNRGKGARKCARYYPCKNIIFGSFRFCAYDYNKNKYKRGGHYFICGSIIICVCNTYTGLYSQKVHRYKGRTAEIHNIAVRNAEAEKYRVDYKIRKPEAARNGEDQEIHYYHEHIIPEEAQIGHIVNKHIIKALGHRDGHERHEKKPRKMHYFI